MPIHCTALFRLGRGLINVTAKQAETGVSYQVGEQ